MNKNKVLAVLMCVLCLSILGDATAAYFTAKDTAHNVITTGNVNIQVVEKQDKNGTLVDYPDGPITGVMPGTQVSKIVTVKNTGTGDAWIRVQVGKELVVAPDAPEKLPQGQAPDTGLITIDYDDAAWVKKGDWYYFRTPLAPGKSTTELFKEVGFAPEMGNAYQGCTANVLVSAQAVQVKNNPLPASGDHSQIPGWPTN